VYINILFCSLTLCQLLVLFHMPNSKSSHSKRRLTDSQMRDAVGRTKVALSVLQKGDCKSGKETVEKALATWS